ncbi:MAG: transporter substrate-binding domain-containing protein, partial [Bifidobacteriaceae bacterium]|nr:transporter substrate-binding domain-containing protein [Bifidobacteriaceae bacterium]
MKISTISRALAGAGAAALALALAACGTVEKDEGAPSNEPADGADATVETVKEGTFTVCTNPPYAPFEDIQGNEVVGFDMDIMAEVAKDMGMEVAFVQAPFESIESAASFDTGSCDAGASGLTITPERQAKMEFSKPYYETTMGLLVKDDSGITDLAGLKDKPVGVQQGTT